MSWYRQIKGGGEAAGKGQPPAVVDDRVEDVIKKRLRSSPFFAALFKKHNVDVSELDGLSISVEPLEDAFCVMGDNQIVIDKELVDSKEIFGPKFHYVAHEILHWLKRKVEAEHYFADPEEVESFDTAIAFFLHQNGGDVEGAMSEFLPLVKITIDDDQAARAFLEKRCQDAAKMLSEMSL